jgi:ribosomal protein S18 acetylase RimI-like enzyme
MADGNTFPDPKLASSRPGCQIGPALKTEYSAALQQLLSDLPPDVCARTRENLLSAAARGEISFDGLIVARKHGQLRGAVWARVGDGRLASVWPPRVCRDESEETVRELLAAMDGYLEQRRVKLAQALLDPTDAEGLTRLQMGGYHVSTDLMYLGCTAGRFPAQRPESSLEFEPFSTGEQQRLIDAVDRTYAETHDFPELNDVCDAKDALAGYRETGAFIPENWLFVREAGVDIGCLLLADHPQDNQYELLYMGLVPQSRGRSLGGDVTRHALWLTGAAQRHQLVLGVDAGNAPALRMYTDLGFVQWDRRRVLLKAFEG